MTDTDAPFRLTLRQLPLPAKLVLSCFLIAVGLGYVSAMVQLHLQHSDRDGNALPTVDNVVERFSGLKKFDGKPGVSKLEHVLLGDPAADDTVGENMAPAFFKKSKGYEAECAARGKAAVDAEREGERQAMLAWLRADENARKAAYTADAFPLPPGPITAAYRAGDAVKVKTLIDQRCGRCHDGNQKPDLLTWADVGPLTDLPKQDVIDGKWVRSSKQMGIDKLTQSTHAHLLSFAVLFTLTGLVFAFTRLPTVVRCVAGPIVLVAQVADVACWWLARIPGVGPYFAMTIIATGSVVGAGLALQIIGSLFSMYGPKGKVVVLLLLTVGLAGFLYLGMNVIEPALKAEREEAAKKAVPAPAAEKKPEPPKKEEPKKDEAKPAVSQLERLVSGPRLGNGAKWDGKENGSMAEAFFNKSDDFKDAVKERGKDVVEAERAGEQRTVQLWIQADDATRKKTYEADAFPLPAERVGKPMTADFLTDDKKAAKIKTLLEVRCLGCHSKDGNEPKFPLETYEQLKKYLGPEK